MALLQEVPQGIKITFTGCMVIFVIFLAVRKKLYLKIGEIKNVFTKEILLTNYSWYCLWACIWASMGHKCVKW